jgi:hypothetical protein
MGQVKILRGFCLGGGIDVHPGDEVDESKIPAGHLREYLKTNRIAIIPDKQEDPNEEETPKKNKGGKKNAE